MLHFLSSSLGGGSVVLLWYTDSLNATQTKAVSSVLFLVIDQKLHDAWCLCLHGQEEDLHTALRIVINGVSELSVLLGEVYKSKVQLEVQLNVGARVVYPSS
ncbi:hypothetical protein B0H10DRAFT_1943347 [Mycena sp. CBHHK59/15]|nr:hypothetical protein B0H10DRAFT_1943347 [Mycena sp. CBHHK59/15]